MSVSREIKVNYEASLRVEMVQQGIREQSIHAYGFGTMRGLVSILRMEHCDTCHVENCDTCRLVSQMLGVVTAVTDAHNLAESERING